MRKFTMGGLTVILAALWAFPAITASAATTRTTAASCSIETLASKPYTRHNLSKSFTSTIQLRYNSCTRRVWAKELGQAPYDHLWVYNEDTHQTSSTNYPHVATSSISDKNTRSHACMDNGTPGYLRMYKTCTSDK